ncbi:MAG: alpha/beta hydrolase [Sarcina sp.]
MKKSTRIALGTTAGISLLTGLATACLVRYAEKEVIRSKRQTKDEMIARLLNQFKCDYKEYENLKVEKIEILSEDDLKLKGYFYKNNIETNKLVIIHHGYTANHYISIQYMKMFLDEGFNVLLIDMRSHGESEGDFASYGYNEVKDLDIWVEAMKEKLGNDIIIGLQGQSMGAATVMLYGGLFEDKVRFVIEDCGYSDAKEEIKYKFKQAKAPANILYPLVNNRIKRKYKFDLTGISPMKAICNSKVPTLFIHGTADTTVPVYMCEEMYNAKKEGYKKLYLVDGAIHMDAYVTDKERYEKEVKDFINVVLANNNM